MAPAYGCHRFCVCGRQSKSKPLTVYMSTYTIYTVDTVSTLGLSVNERSDKGARKSNIIIRNSSEKPLYEQIKEQIKAEIISGRLVAGDQLPSMRYLAKELRISVITTKRAYDDLEQEGFIVSVQGKGSFVAAQNREMLREEHLRKIEEHLTKAIELAQMSGVTISELKELLDVLNGGSDDEYEQ